MPQPDPGSLHIDAALTDVSVRFTQGKDTFVATKVFPQIGVNFRSDKFWVYDRSYWFKTDAQLRGPGAESAGSGFEVTTDDYLCSVLAIHKDVDDQLRANADSIFQVEKDATEFCTQHMLQKIEQDWVSTYFTTGVWDTDVTGGTDFDVWSDYVNGDPISDLRTGIMTMAEATAKKPNTLVLGANVWNKLQDHPDFLERIKYTQKGIVGPDLLATMLGLDNVYVSWSVRNTSQEGIAASYSFNFGDHALLMYVAPSPGLNVASAGYTFAWKGLLGSGATGIRVKKFRLERNATDRIEAEMAYDQKVVSSPLGYFYSGAVA
jgi:hypothetical protein